MHESTDQINSDHSTDSPVRETDDITQLRDRLAFYESFDKLIQDNISRAGELLREAASRKGETEIALRANTAAIERAQMEERINYRRVFSGLLDQITIVQQNVEHLAREVSDALDDLESVIPAVGEITAIGNDSFPSMPTFSTGSGGSLSTGIADWTVTEGESNAAGGFDEESGSELIAESTGDQSGQSSLEPIDEFATPDEADAVESEPDYNPGSGGIITGSDFSSVVQASAERVSQSYGSSELDNSDPDRVLDNGDFARERDLIAEVEGEIDDLPFDVEPEEPYVESINEADTADGNSGSIDEGVDENKEVDAQIEAADNEGGFVPVIAPANEEADPMAWSDGSPPASTTLLVHNVPRATTALSLKRYLEGLDQVHSVEPREYAEGVLRLQVASDRPVGLDDLRGWSEAAGLESITENADFVEVKLAH